MYVLHPIVVAKLSLQKAKVNNQSLFGGFAVSGKYCDVLNYTNSTSKKLFMGTSWM